jgi:hypothetical protein
MTLRAAPGDHRGGGAEHAVSDRMCHSHDARVEIPKSLGVMRGARRLGRARRNRGHRKQNTSRSAARLRPASHSTIRDEITSPCRLGEILRAADERDEVERGIQRASNETLAPDGSTDQGERHEAANPRHRPVEPPGHSSPGVLTELCANGHARL